MMRPGSREPRHLPGGVALRARQAGGHSFSVPAAVTPKRLRPASERLAPTSSLPAHGLHDGLHRLGKRPEL